ncbi:MAG: hypothetical protein IJP48_11940 [Synergistaceae bacterium]|nr:hypothetical protein [Synergistaceae bacterium]
MQYNFYGWKESLNVHAIDNTYRGIKTPCDLYDSLLNIWCEYSCTSRLRAYWDESNITLGQCSITSFLAQDIFGGQVFGILRPEGGIHCYNVVNDHVFDLTSEQFGGEQLDYSLSHNQEQTRAIHFANDEKRQRYEYIKSELERLTSRMKS